MRTEKAEARGDSLEAFWAAILFSSHAERMSLLGQLAKLTGISPGKTPKDRRFSATLCRTFPSKEASRAPLQLNYTQLQKLLLPNVKKNACLHNGKQAYFLKPKLRLTFGELETTACFALTVFLTFNNAAIACQKTHFLQNGAQLRLHKHQRTG